MMTDSLLKPYCTEPIKLPSDSALRRSAQRNRGTVVGCYKCGKHGVTLYKDDNGMICHKCRKAAVYET